MPILLLYQVSSRALSTVKCMSGIFVVAFTIHPSMQASFGVSIHAEYNEVVWPIILKKNTVVRSGNSYLVNLLAWNTHSLAKALFIHVQKAVHIFCICLESGFVYLNDLIPVSQVKCQWCYMLECFLLI